MANALITLGMLVTSLFQDQLLQASLIKEIYQVEQHPSAPPIKRAKSNFGSPQRQGVTQKRKVVRSPLKADKEAFSSADARWLLDYES